LLQAAHRHDIAIRVLEGTPSHDRRQSEQFLMIETIMKEVLPAFNKLDLQYISTLSIVYEPAFNIHILYIPDEWRADNAQTQLEVQKLLEDNQLSTVDYTVIHGTFPYQLPPIAHIPVHDDAYYTSITKHFVLAGHIHISSHVNNILVNGSHDRMSHGEELPKGLWFIVSNLLDPKSDRAKFIINKNAVRFKSFDFSGVLSESANDQLLMYVKERYDSINYKNPLFIRLVYRKEDNLNELANAFKKSFPLIKWSTKITKPKAQSANSIAVLHQFSPNLKVNHNSISPIIKKRLIDKNLEVALIDQTLSELESIKKEVA
jgi:hypothetical protein